MFTWQYWTSGEYDKDFHQKFEGFSLGFFKTGGQFTRPQISNNAELKPGPWTFFRLSLVLKAPLCKFGLNKRKSICHNSIILAPICYLVHWENPGLFWTAKPCHYCIPTHPKVIRELWCDRCWSWLVRVHPSVLSVPLVALFSQVPNAPYPVPSSSPRHWADGHRGVSDHSDLVFVDKKAIVIFLEKHLNNKPFLNWQLRLWLFLRVLLRMSHTHRRILWQSSRSCSRSHQFIHGHRICYSGGWATCVLISVCPGWWTEYSESGPTVDCDLTGNGVTIAFWHPDRAPLFPHVPRRVAALTTTAVFFREEERRKMKLNSKTTEKDP